MGAAIHVMHYTALAARFTLPGMPTICLTAVSISTLGPPELPPSTLSCLELALLTSLVDKAFAARPWELQEEKLQRSEGVFSGSSKLVHGSFGLEPVPTGEHQCWSEEISNLQFDRAMKPSRGTCFPNGFIRKT